MVEQLTEKTLEQEEMLIELGEEKNDLVNRQTKFAILFIIVYYSVTYFMD